MDTRLGRINRVAKYLAEQGLEYLSKVFGITQNEAHRAWCDAEANVGVYFKLKEL